MTGKTGRFIVNLKPVGAIPHHDMSRLQKEQKVNPLSYMDDSMVPEADLVVHVSEVKPDSCIRSVPSEEKDI
jgi:hypothetical protein